MGQLREWAAGLTKGRVILTVALLVAAGLAGLSVSRKQARHVSDAERHLRRATDYARFTAESEDTLSNHDLQVKKHREHFDQAEAVAYVAGRPDGKPTFISRAFSRTQYIEDQRAILRSGPTAMWASLAGGIVALLLAVVIARAWREANPPAPTPAWAVGGRRPVPAHAIAPAAPAPPLFPPGVRGALLFALSPALAIGAAVLSGATDLTFFGVNDSTAVWIAILLILYARAVPVLGTIVVAIALVRAQRREELRAETVIVATLAVVGVFQLNARAFPEDPTLAKRPVQYLSYMQPVLTATVVILALIAIAVILIRRVRRSIR